MGYFKTKELEEQIKRLKAKCCCKTFGFTDGEPTEEPSNGINVLFDTSTGILYYWDGDSWETFGTADSNFFESNLTQDANRSHNAAGFDTQILNQGGFLIETDIDGKFVRLRNTVGSNVTQITIDDDNLEITSDTGTNVSTVTLNNSGTYLYNLDGHFFLGDGLAGFGVPVDNAADITHFLGIDGVGKVFKDPMTNLTREQIVFGIDGAGSPITTGRKGFITVPYDGVITGWTILETSDTPISSSIIIDVDIESYADYPASPTSIAGTEKPTLSGAVKNQDLALGTWTTALTYGDLISFDVESVTDAQKVVVILHTLRTIG